MADMSHCTLMDGGPGGTARSELDQRGNLTNAAVDGHGSPRDSRKRCEPSERFFGDGWLPGARATDGLDRDPEYRGLLIDRSPREVAFMLSEAIEYFGLQNSDMPLKPIDNGPGHSGDLEYHSDASSVWQLGMKAIYGMAQGRPRSVSNAWRDMATLVIHARRDGVNEERARREEADLKFIRDTERRTIADGFVYFIGGDEGPIKIGWSSNVEGRLKGLQTSHAAPLKVYAFKKGRLAHEAWYHKRFAAHRLHGEWFERHPDVLAEIERLSNGLR